MVSTFTLPFNPEEPPMHNSFITVVWYRRNQENVEILETPSEVRTGVTFIECPECFGTGVFEITDTDSQDCNYCKTAGEMPVTI